MPYQKPGVFPEFADLNIVLAQAKSTDNPLYQAIQVLLARLTQYRQNDIKELASKLTETDADKLYASKSSSFLTSEDESATLPNSRQLLAGTGITLDDSIANQLTISSEGVWTPLTDGDVDETDLIFVDGDCVMVFVPNP
jgi:hypothetical protein